ncbi:hypothetical protein T484DRAFT_1600276, partial [Baffinella frigidus]
HTVVTAYFKISSKHTHEDYIGWMRNMLSIQDAMVIFTSPGMVETIRGLRAHAMDKTLIFPMLLKDTKACRAFDESFWESQLDRDPEIATKHSGIHYEVFCVWLSKSWFVTEAIRVNPFLSDIFVWSDIGCFRDSQYTGDLWIQHPEIIPSASMLMMAGIPPFSIDGDWVVKDLNGIFIAGAQFGGRRDTWGRFHAAFEHTLRGYVEQSLFLGEDQALVQTTCMHHCNLCAFVTPDMVTGDEWFGLQDVLHNGKTGALWWFP